MLKDVVIANKSYTKFTVSEEDELDMIALKVMKQDCPDFLMPIRTMEIDGEMEIRYELTGGMRLSYMSRELYKKEFYNMLINMLTPFKNCNDWFLDYHYILLDENYILVDKGGQSVKYVYLPVAACANTDERIKGFFMDLILRTTVLDDRGCMVEPLRIINSGDSNLMVLLNYLLKQSSQGGGQSVKQDSPRQDPPRHQDSPRRQDPPRQDPKPVEEDRKRGVFPRGNDHVAEKKQQELGSAAELKPEQKSDGSRPGQISKEFGKNDDQKRLMDSLFGDGENDEEDSKKKHKKEKEPKKAKEKPEKQEKSGGGFLGGLFKGKSKEEPEEAGYFQQQRQEPVPERQQRQQAEQRQPQQSQPSYYDPRTYINNNGDGDTMIGGGEEVRDNHTLRLRLEDCDGCECPKMIELNLEKGFATVGRIGKDGQRKADFCFDMSVSFVSRLHFRVEMEEDHWRVIDLGSANGTFVNNQKLVQNMPAPVRINDKIMIYCNQRSMVYRVC